MILFEDKKYIMKLVEELTPNILKEINFNPSIKEPGHSFHGPFEAKLVEKLIEADSDFTKPTETRSSDDCKYKGNYTNIKFGYDKHGNPNICSMKRLFKYLHEGLIDSYYILSVDALGPKYQLFDIYDYLDYTNFNYGTGQLMLKENKFKEVYIFNDTSLNLSRVEKIIKIANMMHEECDRHITQKKKQQLKIDEIAHGYKQGILL
tara:strand:+ start:44 stop:661 length:618 start_codon:yes stop_codon:yes gene_type:complete